MWQPPQRAGAATGLQSNKLRPCRGRCAPSCRWASCACGRCWAAAAASLGMLARLLASPRGRSVGHAGAPPAERVLLVACRRWLMRRPAPPCPTRCRPQLQTTAGIQPAALAAQRLSPLPSASLLPCRARCCARSPAAAGALAPPPAPSRRCAHRPSHGCCARCPRYGAQAARRPTCALQLLHSGHAGHAGGAGGAGRPRLVRGARA
jgi:hypothetical protein